MGSRCARYLAAFPGPVSTLLCALLLWGCGSTQISFSSSPPPQTLQLELAQVATGLANPTDLQQPNDGTGRLFVVEQTGRIRIIRSGAVLPTPFLNLASVAGFVESGGEKGLLGLAFHPSYSSNGRFFVNYTTRRLTGGLQTVIAEYHASPASANTALTAETILLTFDQPFDNHNGGGMAFGPDGFLYIASGDGGSGGDPQGNGQNLNTLLGKILRIDVDSIPSPGLAYAIPPSNPFAGQSGRRGEIWAYGLRNPWRFSFDRGGGASARLFAGDVGESTREEIDIITRGGNYGWNIMEGTFCFNPPSGCNQAGLILPIHDYGRGDGGTVVGGYVYRGTPIAQLVGSYVFGDFISGRIWALTEAQPNNWQRTDLLSTGLNISSFGQDQAGELYVLNYSGGSVLRIRQVGTP